MPGLRDLLSRFRAAGAPGAPGAAGMPVDRRAGVAAELEPVFATLAATTVQCERLRAGGAAEAGRCLDEAHQRAAAIVAEAERSAQAERAATTARTRRSAEADLAALDEESRASAEEITSRAAERIPGLVDEVVQRVRRDIAVLGHDRGAGVGSAP